MKIKKGYLFLLMSVLGETTPKFVEARFRDRFLKQLIEEYKTYEEERTKICIALCEKKNQEPILKETVNPITGKTEKNYSFTDKNREKVESEIKILQEEEVKLKLEGDEHKRLVKLVESTKYEPKYGEAQLIDEIIK